MKKKNMAKRKKILLRSNNDYIDHEYWPKMRAKAKKSDKRTMEKHGMPNLHKMEPHQYTEKERAELKKQGIGVMHHMGEPILDVPLRHIPVVGD